MNPGQLLTGWGQLTRAASGPYRLFLGNAFSLDSVNGGEQQSDNGYLAGTVWVLFNRQDDENYWLLEWDIYLPPGPGPSIDTVTTTGTWTAGNPAITVADATGIKVGQAVFGGSIPFFTTVIGISGTSLLLSAAPAISEGSYPMQPVTFGFYQITDQVTVYQNGALRWPATRKPW